MLAGGDEIRQSFDAENLTEKQWLQRICRELVTIRTQMTLMTGYIREAEKEVPEYMRRFMMFMHDLHDISYMYTEMGHEPPPWIKREMELCDDRLRVLLEREHASGGVRDKVRQETAEMGGANNRWDHTKRLIAPKGAVNETRESES